MSMIKYIVKRLLYMIPLLIGVLIITFFLSRNLNTDPVSALLPDKATKEEYFALYHQLGFDRPLIEQFLRYMGDILVGNWGESLSVSPGQDVWEIIWERFPRTIDITLLSLIIASIVGIKTGVISATHRNKPRDTLVRGFSLIGVSIPVFWLAMLLQYVFAFQLGWFPAIGYKTGGYVEPEMVTGFRIIDSFISGEWYLITDYLIHLTLPVFCLSFITLASITRQTRSSMLEVLQQDYVRTARAKGCKERDVINTHARKNALIPTVTIIGLNIGGLLGGAILTETAFNLNGIGDLLMRSIVNADYKLISAIVILTTLMFVLVTLITDLIYAYIDPRIKY